MAFHRIQKFFRSFSRMRCNMAADPWTPIHNGGGALLMTPAKVT
jgi:hypothetical protein